eukprot:1558990-Lingulodinium_polyedra.AAC.1
MGGSPRATYSWRTSPRAPRSFYTAPVNLLRSLPHAESGSKLLSPTTRASVRLSTMPHPRWRSASRPLPG